MKPLPLLALCLAMGCGPPDVEPPPPAVGAVVLVNATQAALADVFVTPMSQREWGADRLDRTLSGGESFELSRIDAGQYDLKAVATDGRLFFVWGFSVGGGDPTHVTIR